MSSPFFLKSSCLLRCEDFFMIEQYKISVNNYVIIYISTFFAHCMKRLLLIPILLMSTFFLCALYEEIIINTNFINVNLDFFTSWR